MNISWTLPIGSIILLVIQFGGGIWAFVKFMNSTQRTIDARFSEFELRMNTLTVGDVANLKGRIVTLEADRSKMDLLQQKVFELMLEVDRLKRPGGGRRETDP